MRSGAEEKTGQNYFYPAFMEESLHRNFYGVITLHFCHYLRKLMHRDDQSNCHIMFR